ncbi:hypothetical protein BHE97_14825 [Aeromicrobium sp. PE09-221]|uniref:hypothetical protein n=1 Tax=Aeromicrobium sp. PE09-221 TaxID=1898043 RepID=UPI000B3ED950|nr:hypothetical protein [Aeromicrobium sp. PE09-221]OUZ07972.1 hypothetical protein BHE97_14825 [Aeromicrobium sp. PE09-221]
MTEPTPSGRDALRTLLMSLLTAPVFILIAVFLIVGGISDHELPPVLLTVGLLALVAAAVGLARFLGAQLPAIAIGTPRDEAMARALGAFRANVMVRYAVLEAPLLIGVVVSFLVDHGAWPLLIAGVPSIVAMFALLWPSQASFERAERRLDRDGGRSYLREAS